MSSEQREPLARRLANTAYVAGLIPLERRVPRLDPVWIDRLQRWRVRSIVRHAYATVPFYRETMDELGLRPEDIRSAEDLSKLPLIDPVTVRSDVERFTSNALGPEDREELGTSGTASTIRGVVYWDNRHVLRSLAKAERDRSVLASLVAERKSVYGPARTRRSGSQIDRAGPARGRRRRAPAHLDLPGRSRGAGHAHALERAHDDSRPKRPPSLLPRLPAVR